MSEPYILYLTAYAAVINFVAFIVYGVDKWRAVHAHSRISESTLLLWAVIGGSVGAWVGMKVWHHKTLHRKFVYGIPSIIFLQLLFAIYLFCL